MAARDITKLPNIFCPDASEEGPFLRWTLLFPNHTLYPYRMSVFKVNVTARNPKQEEMVTQPLSALVDTGSELTWLPADVLLAIGITPRRKRVFATATQQR